MIIQISPLNIFCDPSLESSRQDSSNKGLQRMFSLSSKKNYLELSSIPLISGVLSVPVS